MSRESEFKQSMEQNRAFTAKRVFDLHLLILKQAEDVYVSRGMIFPVAVSSVILFLSTAKRASLTEISKALGQPHQLIAQRVKILVKLALISGVQDPDDKRRTVYEFTEAGLSQRDLLIDYCSEAEVAFGDLSNELGVDLHEVLDKACKALENKSFAVRFPSYGEK